MRGLDAAFFDVVDVEPEVYDFAGWDVLWDVAFEEFLELDGHVDRSGVAHLVVPGDDLAGFFDFRIFAYPGGYGVVVSAGGDECLEGVAAYACEFEEGFVEGAIEVVFAVCSS